MSFPRVLVTGAGGMIGNALAGMDASVVALRHAALDITDERAVQDTLTRLAPDMVINAAALTDLDSIERDDRGALRVNVEGAAILAHACQATGAWLLQLSTDCVFGEGQPGRAHQESDPTAPLNAYGRSKAAGEAAVATVLSNHLILRTSWVFGAGQRGFVHTVAQQLLHGYNVAVASSQRGCPTPLSALVDTVSQMTMLALTGRLAAGCYHYCGDEPVDRLALAEWTAAYLRSSSGQPIGHVVAAQVPPCDVARRAQNSVLDCSRLARTAGIAPGHWRNAMAEMLRQMFCQHS